MMACSVRQAFEEWFVITQVMGVIARERAEGRRPKQSQLFATSRLPRPDKSGLAMTNPQNACRRAVVCHRRFFASANTQHCAFVAFH